MGYSPRSNSKGGAGGGIGIACVFGVTVSSTIFMYGGYRVFEVLEDSDVYVDCGSGGFVANGGLFGVGSIFLCVDGSGGLGSGIVYGRVGRNLSRHVFHSSCWLSRKNVPANLHLIFFCSSTSILSWNCSGNCCIILVTLALEFAI